MSEKIKFCWLPKRIANWADDEHTHFRWIGWVWLQKAYLTKNLQHGWIAFVDNQVDKKLVKPCCPYCKKILPENNK